MRAQGILTLLIQALIFLTLTLTASFSVHDYPPVVQLFADNAPA
jgi:hypothetical protein